MYTFGMHRCTYTCVYTVCVMNIGNQASRDDDGNNDGNNVGLTAGIVGGIIAIIISTLIVVIIIIWWINRRNQSDYYGKFYSIQFVCIYLRTLRTY